MIEIRPMAEDLILTTCLHAGPLDTTTWEEPSYQVDPGTLPQHPWSDETIRGLAAQHKGITHGNCELLRAASSCAR